MDVNVDPGCHSHGGGLRQQPRPEIHSGPRWQTGHQLQPVPHSPHFFRRTSYCSTQTILPPSLPSYQPILLHHIGRPPPCTPGCRADMWMLQAAWTVRTKTARWVSFASLHHIGSEGLWMLQGAQSVRTQAAPWVSFTHLSPITSGCFPDEFLQ